MFSCIWTSRNIFYNQVIYLSNNSKLCVTMSCIIKFSTLKSYILHYFNNFPIMFNHVLYYSNILLFYRLVYYFNIFAILFNSALLYSNQVVKIGMYYHGMYYSTISLLSFPSSALVQVEACYLFLSQSQSGCSDLLHILILPITSAVVKHSTNGEMYYNKREKVRFVDNAREK